MTVTAAAEPPEPEGEDDLERLPGGVTRGPFARSTRSDGVDRPPSIHEIETHREHIRLNLENWEKQWGDVIRYERAVAKDEAKAATARRALARSGVSFGLSISVLLPVVTDATELTSATIGVLSIRDFCVVVGAVSATVTGASLWYAGKVAIERRRERKARTRPLLPPSRLDAVQLLSSLTYHGDPLYYRERDLDEDLDFGWKNGWPSPPRAN